MGLSNELISQFAKITTDKKKTKTETTVYGTVVEHNGLNYVKLDGSGLLTPVTTTASATPGDRVTVLIKNHKAVVTGNISAPSAKNTDLEAVAGEIFDAGAAISQFEIVIAGKVDTTEFNAEVARIDELVSDNITVKQHLSAAEADIDKLQATEISVEKRLTAAEATIKSLDAGEIDVESLKATFATVENLNVVEQNVASLDGDLGEFEELTAERFEATDAEIEDLKANKLSATDIDGKFANIDFSNIGEAAITTLFTKSGLIENVVIGEGTITGQLVGVTIKGDLIEAGTLVADKLVIQGTDGLYYKLNTNGVTTEAEQTDYNSLNGNIITAKSITASKISVNDLVAFGATIGGFHITETSIYSGVKSSVDNSTRGTYLDSDGQIAIGDGTNYIKYYKGDDGNYKLDITADSITLTSESQSIAAAISELSESTQANSADLAAYVSSTEGEITNLQNQIDGSIMTHFYEYEPTNSNIPASEWTTIDVKNNHLGDLFYDTITGYCYRWQIQNGVYSWNRLTDVDVTKALADAHAAQETADSKRRVFTTTPTTPYDIGDLWVQGSTGDILKCKTAKTSSQSYASGDWVAASKYTDDTAANKAQTDVNALTTRVSTAEASISQNANAIALRATKTEVAESLSGYYTKEESDAKLTVKADAITSNVASTYATKTALATTNTNVATAQNTADSAISKADNAQSSIDGLEIGGRNLLTKTRAFTGIYGSSELTGENYKGLAIRYGNLIDSETASMELAQWSSVTNIKHGQQFTLSFYAKGTSVTCFFHGNSGYLQTQKNESSQGVTSTSPDGNIKFTLTDDWERYSVTWTLKDSGDESISKHILIRLYNGEEAYICGVKFEHGNKATDWSPAPEDAEVEIESIKTQVANAETAISQNADAIALRATKTEVSTAKTEAINSANKNTATVLESYSTTAEMNAAIELKANGITSSVKETYATKASVEDIQIGGRNYILNTSPKSDGQLRLLGDTTKIATRMNLVRVDDADYVRFNVSTGSDASEVYYRFMTPTIANLEQTPYLGPGVTYTIAMDYYVPSGQDAFDATAIRLRGQCNVNGSWCVSHELNSDIVTDTWTHISGTFTIDESATGFYQSIQLTIPSGDTAGYFYVRNLKMELGNKATDWTAAPEDLDSDFSNLDTRVTTVEQVSNEVSDNFNNLQVGGRNLVAGTSEEIVELGKYPESSYSEGITLTSIAPLTKDEYVLSFDAKSTVSGDVIRCHFWSPNTTLSSTSSTGDVRTGNVDGTAAVTLTDSWARYWVKYTQSGAETTTVKKLIVGRRLAGLGTGSISIRAIKLEEGNHPTPWTQAPEDVQEDIDTKAYNAQSAADDALSRVATAESVIEQLADSISTLVQDENGMSLMTQTDTGWVFSVAEIQNGINEASKSLDSLTTQVGDVDSTVQVLQQAVDDLGIFGDYIHIGTYENEPCIELGELDSDFKVLITNTRIMFQEGSSVPTYISNQTLISEKIEVTEELKQGGFVWAVRSNGNYGLIWKE